MSSLSDLYDNLKTLGKQWFYEKSEIATVGTSGSYNDLTNKPTIPSASSATPSADTSSGSAGTGTTWARADHKHPKSSLYAEASHTHGNLQDNGIIKVGGTAQASKSVCTDSSGYITTENKNNHAHGDITSAGAIGSTANLPIITTTSGKLTTGSFGTSANTFCQGNDSRLSDARTPTSHTHNLPDLNITTLSSSFDYNDYTANQCGYYWVWNAVQTQCTNAPDTQGGLFTVEKIPNGVLQKVTEYYKEHPKIFYRVYHATRGWSPWHTVMGSAMIPNISGTRDLNNFTEAGFYWCNSNDSAENIANRPPNVKAFYLQVECWSANNVKQTISSYHQDYPHPQIHVRVKNGSNWSPWRKIKYEADTPVYWSNTYTLTSTKDGVEALDIEKGYLLDNHHNWVVTGQINVSGAAARFGFNLHTNGATDATKHIAIGKNTAGNLVFYYSTGASTESSISDENVTFNNDTWYGFQISKNGSSITFNFNNGAKVSTVDVSGYFANLNFIMPRLFKWTTNNVSVRYLKIYPALPHVATSSRIGLMSNTDKTKLDGLTPVNNLTSTSTSAPLAANQGKVLDTNKLNKSAMAWTQITSSSDIYVTSGVSLYVNDYFCWLQIDITNTMTLSKTSDYTIQSGYIKNSNYKPPNTITAVSEEGTGGRETLVKLDTSGNLKARSLHDTYGSQSIAIKCSLFWPRI